MAAIRQTVDFDNTWRFQGQWDPALASFPVVVPSGLPLAQQQGAGYVYVATSYGTVDNAYFIPGDLLVGLVDEPSSTVFAGNWIKIEAPDSGKTFVVNVPGGHGITLGPTEIKAAYQDGVGVWHVASSLNAATSSEAMIVAVPDTTTMVLQQSGVIVIPGHGFSPGTDLYLTANGSGLVSSAIPPNKQVVAQALDSRRLLLFDRGIEIAVPTNGVHTQTFTAADAGWVLDPPNNVYRYTITAATLLTSQVASVTAVAIWENTGGTLTKLTPDTTSITPLGDLSIVVPSIPDQRFAGVIHAFDDNVAIAGTSYSTVFDAAADWGVAAGGFYTITIAQAVHQVAVPRVVSVWDTTGVNTQLVTLDQTSITPTGDIVLQVLEIPDARFAGEVYIY